MLGADNTQRRAGSPAQRTPTKLISAGRQAGGEESTALPPQRPGFESWLCHLISCATSVAFSEPQFPNVTQGQQEELSERSLHDA